MSDAAPVYDVIIIGGGPAGLTAALYAGRARLKTVVLEKGVPGGQAASTDLIDNYPGFPKGITGPELSQLLEEQARKFEAEIVYTEVEKVQKTDALFEVQTLDGPYTGRTVIVATGANPVTLDVPGESELRGRGVSYCATCDGAFFKDKAVAVVGGGDSALTEGMFLTKFASSVTVIHRRDQLRAVKSLQEEAFANPKFRFIWNTVVRRIEGQGKVERLVLWDKVQQKESLLPVDGVFIYVGMRPNTAFLEGFLPLAEGGYIAADARQRTSIPGLFAAGDVCQKPLRQLVTAVADGAVAAAEAEKYIEGRD
ncbi:MAG: thioredoxin-disulfide reductase [Firmicutes bacterium]|nr:thioredoxin-disulfide reductase [Bacillota bacterium]